MAPDIRLAIRRASTAPAKGIQESSTITILGDLEQKDQEILLNLHFINNNIYYKNNTTPLNDIEKGTLMLLNLQHLENSDFNLSEVEVLGKQDELVLLKT